MKRHIIKDIILALLPLALFFCYVIPARQLSMYSSRYLKPMPFMMFNLLAPIILGALLCVSLVSFIKARRKYRPRNQTGE